VGQLAAVGPVEIGRVRRARIDGQKKSTHFYASGRARPGGSRITATLPVGPPADTAYYLHGPWQCTAPLEKETGGPGVF